MAFRASSRGIRSYVQSVRAVQQGLKNASIIERMPQMMLKSKVKLNHVEFLNKKMNNISALIKMNRAEIQRVQVAALCVALSTSSTVVLDLARIISSALSMDEDEEGSSSGVRRRKRRRRV